MLTVAIASARFLIHSVMALQDSCGGKAQLL